jgi:hypothetical protein
VQELLADGAARITETDHFGRTALLGYVPFQTLIWLLEEGGARITHRLQGKSALLLAALTGRASKCQWLKEHGGADNSDANANGKTVWGMLTRYLVIPDTNTVTTNSHCYDAVEMTALLRVMVLKGDPPAELVAQLKPEHAQVMEEGVRLKAALPAYLVRRRALLDAHCPLIAPLLALVRDYDPGPTTTEELWAAGLGAAPQRE